MKLPNYNLLHLYRIEKVFTSVETFNFKCIETEGINFSVVPDRIGATLWLIFNEIFPMCRLLWVL